MNKVSFTIALIGAFCFSTSVFATPSELSGEWELTTLNGETVGRSIPVTIKFISDQSVAEGFSGCSMYNTLYYAIGTDGIQFGSIATLPPEPGMPDCDGVIATETAYFEALAETAAWFQDGESLTMQNVDGAELLHFSNVDQSATHVTIMSENVMANGETTFLIILSAIVGLSILTLIKYPDEKRSMR